MPFAQKKQKRPFLQFNFYHIKLTFQNPLTIFYAKIRKGQGRGQGNEFYARCLIKRWAKAFTALFYPPLCLHCRQSLQSEENIFCSSCMEWISLIDPSERCPFVFLPIMKKKVFLREMS